MMRKLLFLAVAILGGVIGYWRGRQVEEDDKQDATPSHNL